MDSKMYLVNNNTSFVSSRIEVLSPRTFELHFDTSLFIRENEKSQEWMAQKDRICFVTANVHAGYMKEVKDYKELLRVSTDHSDKDGVTNCITVNPFMSKDRHAGNKTFLAPLPINAAATFCHRHHYRRRTKTGRPVIRGQA